MSASFRFPLRVAATLALALAAAALCLALHTPLPWMIGPLLAVSLASIAGAPTASANGLRNVGQWTIGTALGLYFTPQVVALVASIWWAIVLAIAWALVIGGLFGRWLEWQHGRRMPHITLRSMRATAYFSGAIGGASEMTLMAERVGARTDLVAAAHSLRLMIVTLVIPFAMQWSGLHGLEIQPPALRNVQWGGLVVLALATGVGAVAMRATGRNNPWFIGPLLVAIGFTVGGWQLSAVPQWLSNAAQLVIAVSLGVRFSREFLHTAPRWLLSVAGGTVMLIALCAGFAFVLAWATGLHPATLILGTSPGGIAEMSITAKVLQLGVPVVTAFQVCRLIAVLLLVGPMYGWLYGRKA
ncbi:AbrB family transcriptional regulator [Variovorax guangxiensis]|uniref:AbrB family transcriptional regulator n=1 Tax=Variovorax guangxiensis TaxID=1775474 RepID=A0A502DYQ0_9BURK|nr:AbrB family transcriptional regulator [Variovorax guangxiensis]TPG25163.1 AbrB family transcriptional regulator [Variovorax ginsengisoli]TPG29411.1 AbrB family transcriptional regulator [Variovorax guangxiensis]